ncbi:MAG TPA: hypothetical protein VNQ53_14130 [Nocardioides sp.]|nr:hypothetical protein [Nocardioides sp.]
MNQQPQQPQQLAAASVAFLGAAQAVPIPLAQLDFAGAFNAFNIDHGDSPQALLVMAAVGGVLTCAVIVLAFVGAILLFVGSEHGRPVLIGAAVAGLATAFPLWVPTAVILGVAALIASKSRQGVARPEPLDRFPRFAD